VRATTARSTTKVERAPRSPENIRPEPRCGCPSFVKNPPVAAGMTPRLCSAYHAVSQHSRDPETNRPRYTRQCVSATCDSVSRWSRLCTLRVVRAWAWLYRSTRALASRGGSSSWRRFARGTSRSRRGSRERARRTSRMQPNGCISRPSELHRQPGGCPCPHRPIESRRGSCSVPR
jgi:hypothetical protein